jgi:anaerobic selenocysteine-containing dehydrogenase
VPWDLRNAGTIVIWGKNPAETNIQEMAFIADAHSRGSRIIVIDPLRTPTADKADVLYSPKPGTDAALALAVARILIDENLIDMDFINKHVAGFDKFKQSLSIDAEKAADITGIPSENIRELAVIIGMAKPLTIIPGYGLQRHLNGGQTIRALLSLIVLTGNIGRPGSGFNYANLQSYIYDDPKEPLSYYPDPAGDKPFRRFISMARFAEDAGKLSSPPVKAMWVERGNPLLQLPDSEKVKKYFCGLEFRVVIDQFMNDTAAEADLILPAKDIFEQSDIIGSYWSPYVQFKPKVIDPPGEVIPETELYYHLASRMKMNLSADLIPEPGNGNIEKWLEKRINGASSITLNDLKQGPVIPDSLQQIAYEDMKFDTPSGKIELFSDQARKLWNVSELPEYAVVDKDDYPFTLLTPNAAGRIHSQFGNLKIIRETCQQPGAMLSLKDADKLGIHEGEDILITNANGSVKTIAFISGRIPEGIVVLHNGIWTSEGGGGNNLIPGRETDMGYGSAFHDARVRVERRNR